MQRFDTLMKQSPFLLLFLAATLLALPAQAVTVLDNTTQYPTSNTSSWTVSDYADRVVGYTKIASSFTTGASDATLNSVSLLLNPSTNISLSSASLTVAIYSDTTALSYYQNNGTGLNNGNITKTAVSHPLLQMGLLSTTFTRPNPTFSGTQFTYTSAAGIDLAANTTYWIVLSSTDASGYYSVAVDAPQTTAPASFTSGLTTDWSVRSGTTAASVDFAVFTHYATTHGANGTPLPSGTVPADSWISSGNEPLFFKIDATVTGAPEPSKALLTMLGMLSLGLRRSRRR